MQEPFWIYDWLDSRRIQTVSDAARVLSKTGAMEELVQIAQGYDGREAKLDVADDTAVIAGKEIDLSGVLGCNHVSCRKERISDLFNRVWHYFDRIIVADAMTHKIAAHWSGDSLKIGSDEHDNAVEDFLSDVEILLYLRKLGLDVLLAFVQKRLSCFDHIQQHAEEVGIESCLNRARQLAEVIAKRLSHVTVVSDLIA